MIRTPELGLRRWQDEVARDPGSPSFVPLADLYRVQGRLEIAWTVCVRGLERNPTHVEGHYLLGRIYRDRHEAEKAYDEWDIALHLDPLHAGSRRAIAFLCLEQGHLEEAERHLTKALQTDPDDPRLRRALRHVSGGADRVVPGADYWDAVAALLSPRIKNFAREARVRLTAVLDASANVLIQQGFTAELDLAAFASLAAATHAASREIARVLGQPGFSQLYQGRGEHQLFIGSIPAPSGELLLVTVFGEDTTIGLVRALFRDLLPVLERSQWPAMSSEGRLDSLEAELAAGLARAASHPVSVSHRGR